MLYFVFNNNTHDLVDVVPSDEANREKREQLRASGSETLLCRADIKTVEQAEAWAKAATELTGETHIVTYSKSCLPHYDVIRAPHVGDKVSKAFNGDYYPEGEVVKVSASLKRVETSTGEVFYRRKQTGSWLEGQTWSLIQGHVDRRNPHF